MSTLCRRATAVPSFITVQIDTREKYPLPFPANIRISDPDVAYHTKIIPVKVEKIKLDIGDYRLKEFPDDCVIERKGSPLEIFKNLFNARDSIRSAKAFRKLSTVQYPYLLLEMSPANLMSASSIEAVSGIYDPETVMHRLSLVISKYGLNVVWAPKSSSTKSRRSLGLILLHLMLGYGLREITKVLLDLSDVVPDRGLSHND